jgi:hypothetical protein
MVEANGGEVDTSNPGTTCHVVAPAVAGTYHQAAEYFGGLVESSTHSAHTSRIAE